MKGKPVETNDLRALGETHQDTHGIIRGSRRLHHHPWHVVILVWGVAIILAFFILGPLCWLSLHAFASNWTYPHLLPEGWTFHWWTVVFSDPGLGVAIHNSLVFAPLTVAISAVICLPAAYSLSRIPFPGRRVVLVGLFATNAFPKMGLFVTMSTLFTALNLMNTVTGILIVHLLGTIVFMTWLPAAAFSAVPRNLEEAARDSGAGWWRTFLTVTLPIAWPGILVALVMCFLASFDESQGTYLVGAPTYMTMPTEMYSLVLNSPRQVAAVFSIILTIPSVVLMTLARRHIMGGRLADGFQIR
ncbi:putative spermidine/putrescine transport system permease protein [Propionibacterium cyclohexanicum]|uniref:Putative spermidine/putrescine transport system permease protein n=1 Tax=Propionibacterium cyclohexanicum TaxID=64702 RepID=A0A1H9QE90_9ACTN|nr:ABC transporter permease [Propionibacterium cyclohexanicum]SER58728.1 putative spermidine/putrescine transport system permease protein [Propionibacterium cyclohexanicum]